MVASFFGFKRQHGKRLACTFCRLARITTEIQLNNSERRAERRPASSENGQTKGPKINALQKAAKSFRMLQNASECSKEKLFHLWNTLRRAAHIPLSLPEKVVALYIQVHTQTSNAALLMAHTHKKRREPLGMAGRTFA